MHHSHCAHDCNDHIDHLGHLDHLDHLDHHVEYDHLDDLDLLDFYSSTSTYLFHPEMVGEIGHIQTLCMRWVGNSSPCLHIKCVYVNTCVFVNFVDLFLPVIMDDICGLLPFYRLSL